MAVFAEALGGRLRGGDGRDMAVVVDIDPARRPLLESVVRTVAGVFDAAASSLALVRPGGSLLYYAAWGAGAEAIVGRELDPGRGIASRVIEDGRPQLVADVRDDPDWDAAFAQQTGFVPSSMMVVPLDGPDGPLGVLTVLDRRDGRPYDVEDLGRARLFARLAVDALLAGRDAGPDTRTAR
jgi:hypothetical protein